MRSWDLATVIAAAQRNDQQAWTELVNTWSPLLRRQIRGCGLRRPVDVEDVLQATWLQAFCGIGTLQAPEALPGWLSVIARRAAYRALERAAYELPVAEPPEPEIEPALEEALSARERAAAVRGAIARLPGRQREVLQALLAAGTASYQTIADVLAIPPGSIGPTRIRALARLRGDAHLVAVVAG